MSNSLSIPRGCVRRGTGTQRHVSHHQARWLNLLAEYHYRGVHMNETNYSNCTICVPWTYFSDGLLNCTECIATGNYQSSYDMMSGSESLSDCTLCPAGSHSTVEGPGANSSSSACSRRVRVAFKLPGGIVCIIWKPHHLDEIRYIEVYTVIHPVVLF
jgi:hypothetical protein